MKDEYLYLWAQWGILTCDRHAAIIEYFGDLETAWHRIGRDFLRGLRMSDEKIDAALEIKNRISLEQILDLVRQFHVRVYYVRDADYPELLKNLSKPPPFIFVRGSLPSFHKSISVVGTRAHSDYGRNVAERFTADLSRDGFVVVSGLALGIDTVAHRITVQSGGITVAVLGSGVDKIYPSSNYRLAQEILSSGGALVSAFPLGTPAYPHHFPQRNYIVAGLTLGTLVVEGGERSGALITADAALAEGRAVFAVPSNISNLALSGTNKLIRNSAAKLVENADHILEDFGMKGALMSELKSYTQEELLVLERLSFGAKNVDELLQETTFNIPELAEIILTLQIKNALTHEGNRYALK